MARFLGISFAAVFALFLAVGDAPAQTMPPYFPNQPNYGVGFRPRLSPYLDLANGGNPAVNYYLGTLPEFDRRATHAPLRRRHQRSRAARSSRRLSPLRTPISLLLLPPPAMPRRSATPSATSRRRRSGRRRPRRFRGGVKRRRNQFVHDSSFSGPRS